MKLYELSAEYADLTGLLDEESVPEENVKARLALIEEALKDKAENIGKIILSNNAETEALSQEITRLTQKRESVKQKNEWLKEYLLTEMQTAKLDKIKGVILTVSLRTNPPSVASVDVAQLAPEFTRVIPEERQPDKVKILAHFKQHGEILPGVSIVTDKKSLIVR